MISWGLVSAACVLIAGPTSFLTLRFLLGVAEAGFFPGVILYITYWFPAHYRAVIVGVFMVAIPVAGLIGSPISGGILYLDGALGLGGWQWIFIIEAAPAVLLGIAAFVWLTDRPQHASWLTREQQQWLVATIDAERRRVPRVEHPSVWRVISNKYVLIMALVYSGAVGASTARRLNRTPRQVEPDGRSLPRAASPGWRCCLLRRLSRVPARKCEAGHPWRQKPPGFGRGNRIV